MTKPARSPVARSLRKLGHRTVPSAKAYRRKGRRASSEARLRKTGWWESYVSERWLVPSLEWSVSDDDRVYVRVGSLEDLGRWALLGDQGDTQAEDLAPNAWFATGATISKNLNFFC